MGDDIEEARRQFVLNRIKTDLNAADFQLSLLVAALSSYRHDTVLRPFPPMFQGETAEIKNYKQLELTTRDIPTLTTLLNSAQNISGQALELLHWSLNAKNFTLKSCKKEKFDEIKERTGQAVPVATPSHIFEVVHSETQEDKFTELRSGRDVWLAYHGSRVENFHSILHYGLNSHMNKNSLYGEGTYLSSEMSVSMPYAPTGKSWDHSVIGDRLSCFAVCEIIDDDSVKCQVKDSSTNDSSTSSRSRSRAPDSMGGDVPEKYYVVRNNEVVRLKYVLIYAEKSKPKRSSTSLAWVMQHKFLLTMLLYGCLLLAIGLYNSKSFRSFLRRYFR